MLIYLNKKSNKHTSKHYFFIRQKKTFENQSYIPSANQCKGVTYIKSKERELLFHLYFIHRGFTPLVL